MFTSRRRREPSPPAARRPQAFAATEGLATLGEWLRFGEKLLSRSGLAFGQVATNPHDEALALILHALKLPLDSGSGAKARRLRPEEKVAVLALLRRRMEERIPTAYLTREAWLGGKRFYVDERVIIPRSYFVEIIPRLGRWLGAKTFSSRLRIADVCTGSGCLAILLAGYFPGGKVDAIDLDPGALEVARINLRSHRLARRVRLWTSDLFDAVPPARYDLIVSNPPYEPSARLDTLPPEFRREPWLALDGGVDGLAVIRRLIRQARQRLSGRGALLIEVGGLRRAIDREFAAERPEWLPTEDGSDCICLIRAGRGAAKAQGAIRRHRL